MPVPRPYPIAGALLSLLRQSVSRRLVGRTSVTKMRPPPRSFRVLPAERVPTPELAAMPLFPEAAHLARPEYESGEGRCYELTGVRLYTYLNLVLTRTRRIVSESNNDYLMSPNTHPSDLLDWHGLYGRRATRLDGLVMSLRSCANNYYHTLVDNLPRLYALHQPELSARAVTLLVPGELQPWEAYFLPLVMPPGVSIRLVPHRTLFAPRVYLLSTFLSRQMAGYLPRRYLEFFLGRVLPKRRRVPTRRILISRRNAPVGRRMLNEAQVSAALARKGFETYALETMPLADQIELFYDARIVVGAHGAGLANLLFADRAGVVELHPTQRVYPHYYLLCTGMGHRYRYLCGDGTGKNSDFTVDLRALERAVVELEDLTASG